MALSGGGIVERNSEARSQIEALAEHAIRARGPQIIALEPVVDPNMPDTDEANLPKPSEQSADENALARVGLLGGERGLSMPIYDGDEAEAVVIAVWSAASTAGPLHMEAADLVAQVLGESLTIQARAHPSIWRRVGNWVGKGIRAIFGKTAWKIKFFGVITVMLAAALSLWPTRYEPNFTARIEAQDRRIISAPFDGFLADAPFQLGDVIEPGALILGMEDSDLVLQAAQIQSERDEVEAEIQTARSQRDTARVQSLVAQRRQVAVQLDLAERQLDLAQFVSTDHAAVVGGDAWRRVGGRVRLGEPLLEVASPDTFRLLVFIDEDWVADLGVDNAGTLLLTAYPSVRIPVTLRGITSDPQMREGVNTFPAWMDFDGLPDVELLDGMRGVVRIDGGRTNMLAAYMRGTARWLRRTVWRWRG
jgi:multidrug resistance efflux pump